MRRSRAAFLGFLVLLATGCGAPSEPDVTPTPAGGTATTAAATNPAAPESFTLVATGDVLIHQDRALTAGARQADGSHDFTGVLAGISPMIRDADVAVCHLETPVAPPGGPYRGYPSFAVQPEIVDALAGAGYDLCSTASNHALDDGAAGLVRTLDALATAGIAATGTYRTQAEAVQPRIVEVGGIRVGHVAGTFALNGVPLMAGREWSVDVVDVPDVEPMLAAAGRARAAGAEVVVASLHCCVEYAHDPTDAQVAAVKALLASPDVDLVLGHHAHVVQPFELIAGEWAAFGLGNHVAEHATRGHPTEDSVMARFTFTRGDDGRFAVTSAEAVPLSIVLGGDRVTVEPADPATFERVAAVLDRRGAVAAGLAVVAG